VGEIIRRGDQLDFKTDGETEISMSYCSEASPAMYICANCGAMVHTSHAEIHAVFHGWKR
jgi:hypothetical protein